MKISNAEFAGLPAKIHKFLTLSHPILHVIVFTQYSHDIYAISRYFFFNFMLFYDNKILIKLFFDPNIYKNVCLFIYSFIVLFQFNEIYVINIKFYALNMLCGRSECEIKT